MVAVSGPLHPGSHDSARAEDVREVAGVGVSPWLPRNVSLLYLATVPAPLRNFLIPYAAHFRQLGWRVDAAASGGPLLAPLREAFDNVYDIPLSRSILDVGANARGERAIERLLGERYDIVHVHTPIAAFLARVAARRLPAGERPLVVYTAHGFHFFAGGNPPANAAFRTAERIAGRWTDRLVVINEDDWLAARASRIVPPRRLVAMPGIGIDTGRYSLDCVPIHDQMRARSELGIGLHVPLFVLIGEFHPNKRQADALAAVAAMRHSDARLVLLGEGPERGRLERECGRLSIRHRVLLPGFVEDVRPILASATALVLTSRREGLSRSVMEALSLGVPVIATTARGNRELVGDDAGLIVPTGDIRALAGAMDWLVDHPAEAEAMGRCGRARMVETYDLPQLLRRHEELYAALLAERGTSVRS